MLDISLITAYINELVALNKAILLRDFVIEMQQRFYPDQDISFMDEFMEYASMENEGKFIIPHQKLIEFGVVTSTRSNDIKDRLTSLGLVEDEDFTLRNVPQRNKNGRGATTKKIYMLTPESFFTALQRAQRRSGQSVDPIKYAKYFQFLQKVILYYSKYETAVEASNNAHLTNENKSLHEKMDRLHQDNQILHQDNLMQSNEIAELKAMTTSLISHTQDTNTKLDLVQSKLDLAIDCIIGMAGAVLPMLTGYGTIRTQFENLLSQNTVNQALLKLKISFSVGFYKNDKMIIYFCCTNFQRVPIRINELKRRHGNMIMIKPQALRLVSSEINTELNSIKEVDLDHDYIKKCSYTDKTKSFTLHLDDADHVLDVFNYATRTFSVLNIQLYRVHMDNLIDDEGTQLSEQTLKCILDSDNAFNDHTRPFCQQYINCYFTEVNGIVEYNAASSSKSLRPDLNNIALTDRYYALYKIKSITDNDNISDVFANMVREGIITTADKPALKKLAKATNVDVSDFHDPESDGSDDSESE